MGCTFMLGVDVSEQLPSAMRLDRAFDDPAVIRRLVEVNGPFASIASYLPPAATGVRSGGGEPDDVLPWFRSNWVVNGTCRVGGAEMILHNDRFIEAACVFLGVDAVEPSTVVVNVNAPMRAGAIHQDIPAFRGAGRDRYALTLLQAMGTSGLFESWRIVEVGAVAWFYAGKGGAYDYWPDGLDGPMASEQSPFDNVALLADNDRMFHRIGWVGSPDAAALPITSTATIDHDEAGWTIRDGGTDVDVWPDSDVRISILWKARPALVPTDPPPLRPEQVVAILDADLAERGQRRAHDEPAFDDNSWVRHVHDTYYPDIRNLTTG
jgi:hypothetical protein